MTTENNEYLVILFAGDVCGGETLTMSRSTSNKTKKDVVALLTQEAGVSDEEIDTILVLENGATYPKVLHHWSGLNGDFEDVDSEDDSD